MINLTSRKIGILSTSVGAILIGIVPILVRTSEISPALTGFYRFLIASIILFIYGIFKNKFSNLNFRDVWILAIPGLFFGSDITLWHWSINQTSVANAALFVNTAPIYVAIISYFLFKENLDFYLENREFDNQKEVVMLNSKGFGGNNATTALLSSNLTESLLSKKYSKTEISKWKGGRDKTLIEREKNMDLAVNNDLQPIYDFDKDVLDLTDLEISKTNIKTTTGFDYKLESDISDDDF